MIIPQELRLTAVIWMIETSSTRYSRALFVRIHSCRISPSSTLVLVWRYTRFDCFSRSFCCPIATARRRFAFPDWLLIELDIINKSPQSDRTLDIKRHLHLAAPWSFTPPSPPPIRERIGGWTPQRWKKSPTPFSIEKVTIYSQLKG
jgi:hypothetical protein